MVRGPAGRLSLELSLRHPSCREQHTRAREHQLVPGIAGHGICIGNLFEGLNADQLHAFEIGDFFRMIREGRLQGNLRQFTLLAFASQIGRLRQDLFEPSMNHFTHPPRPGSLLQQRPTDDRQKARRTGRQLVDDRQQPVELNLAIFRIENRAISQELVNRPLHIGLLDPLGFEGFHQGDSWAAEGNERHVFEAF